MILLCGSMTHMYTSILKARPRHVLDLKHSRSGMPHPASVDINTLGAGVDIEDVASFRNLDLRRDSRFLHRIFSDEEIAYCFSFADPAPHLAARFCAKEAVAKALSGFLTETVAYREIDILADNLGRPSVRMGGANARKLCCKVSLSHCDDKAIAFAIVVTGSTCNRYDDIEE